MVRWFLILLCVGLLILNGVCREEPANVPELHLARLGQSHRVQWRINKRIFRSKLTDRVRSSRQGISG